MVSTQTFHDAFHWQLVSAWDLGQKATAQKCLSLSSCLCKRQLEVAPKIVVRGAGQLHLRYCLSPMILLLQVAAGQWQFKAEAKRANTGSDV